MWFIESMTTIWTEKYEVIDGILRNIKRSLCSCLKYAVSFFVAKVYQTISRGFFFLRAFAFGIAGI
jgi:hypothetical protein